MSSLRRGLPVILLLSAAAGAAQAGPVEGDRALLDLIRAGISTTRAAHTTGGLRARYLLSGVLVTKIDIRWEEGKSRGRYSQRLGGDPASFDSRGVPFPPEKFFVQNDSVRATYSPNNLNGASLYLDYYSPLGPPRFELNVLPRDVWFDVGGPFGPPGGWEFKTLLDPDEPWLSQADTAFRVTRDGDLIFVDRTRADGASFRATASLAVGGNIISYEMGFPSEQRGRVTYSGTREWVPAGDSFTVTSLTVSEAAETAAYHPLRIEYEPLPEGRVPKAAPYTVASLNVPAEAGITKVVRGPDGRTPITSVVRHNRSRLLRPPTDPALLKELGEAAAGSSFAGGS